MVLKKEYIGKCNSSLFLYWCSILNCTINMCQVVHLLMQLRVCSDIRGIWAKMAVYLILLRYRIAIIVIFNRKRLVFLRIRDAIDYIASHIASYVPLLSWTHFIMDSVALTNIFMDSRNLSYNKAKYNFHLGEKRTLIRSWPLLYFIQWKLIVNITITNQPLYVE